MHHHFNRKTAIAAALLVATSWVGAQTAADTAPSRPGSMNSTTSPDPLQTRPADGTPNSATGSQTPGTGTGSSRTMRNPTPMMDAPAAVQSSTTPMPATDMKTEPTTNAAPMARPARRDRG